MKEMKKIVLTHLPPPLEQALRQQLQGVAGVEVLSDKNTAETPDLIVTGGAAVSPGVPILPLLLSRVQRLGVILRQMVQMLSQPVLYIDDIILAGAVFKPQEKILTRDTGEDVALTDREVDVLAYLARRRAPVSRDELLKNVWQYQAGVDTHTIETHIYRLRQKIEQSADTPQILQTGEGGYVLRLEGA